MNNVLVFAGSNSISSINKQLAEFAAQLLEKSAYQMLDLNDFKIPLFGIDEESQNGFPTNALAFDNHIKECTSIILSLAEHNGSYTAVFKNLFDWLSRISKETWQNKPMLLMSASPGGRGGAGVLEAATARFPRHNAEIIEVFSLPFFNKNFENGSITDEKLLNSLKNKVKKFESSH